MLANEYDSLNRASHKKLCFHNLSSIQTQSKKSINTEYRNSIQGIAKILTVGKQNVYTYWNEALFLTKSYHFTIMIMMLMLDEICFLRYGSHVT